MIFSISKIALSFVALFLIVGGLFAPMSLTLEPQVADAALVPCGDGERDADGAVTDEDMCKIGDLFLLVQNIINWLLIIMIPLATLSIGIAGAMLIISGGNDERRSQAKDIIKYAVMGLVLALAAWIVVKSLVGFLLDPASGVVVPLENTE